MSGPYCKDCHYSRKTPFSKDRFDCCDDSKTVVDRNGNIAIDSPEVHGMYSCSNWQQPPKDSQ